ncbi:sigma-70 family RNA polymerase sigma factor, partial [Mycobacterium avium]|uniref:sigma-70 family RNA polymerase sigma factor n=1 Tax=Mycobacterium avium TaxID=1764 RepID=UPI0039BEC38C
MRGRYGWRRTGGAGQSEDVGQETLLRAWQHPEVIGDTERSARAWLFTVARNMIIDDRRSARFRNVVGSTDTAGAPEQSTPDEVNAALDRLLIADAMAPLSAEHRAVIDRSYHRGWNTGQTAKDLSLIHNGRYRRRTHGVTRRG